MKYKIVGAAGCCYLDAKVNELLQQGWKLEGGICAVRETPMDWMFYQAMSFGCDPLKP